MAFRLFKNRDVEFIGDERKDVHPFLGDDRVSASGEEADEIGLKELVVFL